MRLAGRYHSKNDVTTSRTNRPRVRNHRQQPSSKKAGSQEVAASLTAATATAAAATAAAAGGGGLTRVIYGRRRGVHAGPEGAMERRLALRCRLPAVLC